jgi:hypothetical protein
MDQTNLREVVYVIRFAKYTLIIGAIFGVVFYAGNQSGSEQFVAEVTAKSGTQSDSSALDNETKALIEQSRSKLLNENRDGIEGMWHTLYETLEKLTEHHSKQEQLPHFSWLSPLREDKESNLDKLRSLSERLLIELGNPKITSLRNQYFELKSKINDDLIAAKKASEDSYLAPAKEEVYFWQSHRGDYEELKKKKESAVKAHQQEQQQLIVRCHDELVRLGIELTSKQVEQLFKLSSGDLMLTLFATFAQLNLLGDYVTERMQAAKTDESYAYLSKRYYAVYVAIISLSLDIHNFTRDKLLSDHLNRLDQLRDRLNKVIRSTQVLIKNEKVQLIRFKRQLNTSSADKKANIRLEIEEAKRYINQLKSNLTVQENATDGALAYRKHILKQSEEIKRTAKKIARRFKIAFNTYQTVLIGTNQFNLMKEGLRDLSNLQKIQVPAMVPLAGERITNHLEMITKHFNGEDTLSTDTAISSELKR